ncbi:MAG: UDP-N-acetylmuramoyl-tripeptide--D-alanyl-D-alanine ligase [Candidatus Obscuribacterales bacterium]|nr:UDP-N-acetylmuramoyl-tripeptide--D-alanyl-D-alanine ligase [Candidatus Obscuribacterales bacterium]
MDVALSTVFAFAAGLFFYYRRSLRYLKYFQQEDYTNRRFFNWIFEKRAFDRKGSVACLLTIGLCAKPDVLNAVMLVGSAIAAMSLAVIGQKEEDPRTTGKIKLNMTARSKRIYNLAMGLYVVAALAALGGLLFCFLSTQGQAQAMDTSHALFYFWIAQLILVQSQPYWLIAANALLRPYETGLQEGFANEARALIKKHNPTIVGITGSYGKTSTKIILREILGSVAPTFVPPGSINSYMGVTREIREKLQPVHKYAVIEMGAYYIGSIKKMCSLTPPQAAIITAIGIMHLERFGGQDSVYKAKSELAQAVPEDGILVVNGDDPRCRQIAQGNKKKTTLLYGWDESNGHLDAVMYDVSATDKGSNFKIRWQGQEFEGFTQLLGKPLLSNALASFTMACALGIAPQTVISAMRNVRTEKNRLEPVKVPIGSFRLKENGNSHAAVQGEVLRLNDAYNSNPIGFAAALDVLNQMTGGRKILVTPGMIELGDKQVEENKKAGSKAATVCDLVIIVGDTNKQSLTDGLKEGGFESGKLQELADMHTAFNYLSEFCKDGDVVLIENDLGDLYEGAVSF